MADEEIYRDYADVYAGFSAHSPPNAWYDRPAILRLAGEVAGRRVLELGCAAGVLTGQLADRGADVLALDREPQMVALARRRLQAADLQRPLDMVADASIDLVVASLVLHYLRDWRPLLAELHRCLAPRGALVFSVHHPITGWQLSERTGLPPGRTGQRTVELGRAEGDRPDSSSTSSMNPSPNEPAGRATPRSCISCRPCPSSSTSAPCAGDPGHLTQPIDRQRLEECASCVSDSACLWWAYVRCASSDVLAIHG